MGLFGSTKIYVSSVAYNMAGDVNERPNFLKTLVGANIIQGGLGYSVGEGLNRGYLTGPGIQIRSFHRWCKRPGNYDQIGIVTARVMDETDITPYLIASYIPHPSDQYESLANLRKGPADYSFWADQYMMNNHLSAFGEAWTSQYDASTNQITITRADGVTTYTFTPADFIPGENYIYATYNLRLVSNNNWVSTKMWIYRIGSGIPEIDDAVSVTIDTSDEFLGIIPVRIENEFISDSYMPEVYAQAKKAYKKATRGQKFDDLVAQVADNESLADIDHAYVVFGVSLNTADKHSRRYIFNFFERMLASSAMSWTIYNDYISALGSWEADYAAWRASLATWRDEHPGEPLPPPPIKPDNLLLPANSVIFRSNGLSDAKLNMQVKWTAIRKLTGTGLGKPGAKVGEIWWATPMASSGGVFSIFTSSTDELTPEEEAKTRVTLYWQKTADSWEAMEVIGLTHHNLIYEGEADVINAYEALTDEDESPFLIPIHYDTLTQMSLVDSTQMMLSSTYLVLNCYKVVKQKWYQTGIFKVVLFAVMIAVTIAFPPLGAGSSALFSSIGTALGFAGIGALIVGALAFSLISMVVMKILGKIAIALFGEKWGAIIAAVATFVAMTVGTGMLNGQSLAASWGNMMAAPNLIGLTSAVGSGISGFVAASANEFMVKTQNLQAEYEKQSAEVSKLYADTFGSSRGIIDPLGFTEAGSPSFETETQFLLRTLMTGSDIAEMSMGMIGTFADLTVSSELPGVD